MRVFDYKCSIKYKLKTINFIILEMKDILYTYILGYRFY